MKLDHVDLPSLRRASWRETLLEIAATRVWVLSRGRNAWHSTWARHYQGKTSLFSTAAAAKSAAERLRVQGSVFYVTEAPALLLCGVARHVAVLDFHPKDPFSNFAGVGRRVQLLLGEVRGLYRGVTMIDAVSSFRANGNWSGPRLNEDSIRMGAVVDPKLLPSLGRRPFSAFNSFGQGADYYLGWETRPNEFDGRGTRAVVRAWQAHVRADPACADVLQMLKAPGASADALGLRRDASKTLRAARPPAVPADLDMRRRSMF